MSTFEFYDSKLGYYNYIVDGVKVYPSPIYKFTPKKQEVKNNIFVPTSTIKCPYCKKLNHSDLKDFKDRQFIKEGQSKRFYVCKSCGREVDI